MLKRVLIFLLIIISFWSGWFLRGFYKNSEAEIEINNESIKANVKPLDRYTIENLSRTNIDNGNFEIKENIKETDDFNSYLFTYEFNPNLDGKTLKKTTGQINIPNLDDSKSSNNIIPVILMFRGYIDQNLYKTGDGTRNAAEYFTKEGFITIAPDFLGYAGSDSEAENIFETRFQTYVTAVSLLKYLGDNPNLKLENGNWQMENIYLWGHSNGGQIALTTLEITGTNNPTTLWAPVSKSFPYSVLYYTDKSEDRGKLIRTELAKLEKSYDVEKYSLTNYLDKINAPIQIHQGEEDEAVPKSWSVTLVNLLKQKEKDVTYYTYQSTDHNMRPNWDTVVERDIEFFKGFIKD